MVAIYIKEGESIEFALRKFKRDCIYAGILSEIKRREFYEKPSLVRKREKQILKRKIRKRNKMLKRKESLNTK